MRKVSQKALAFHWLEKRLENGPVNSATVRHEYEAMHKGGETALYRAAAALDVISVSVQGEFGRMTMWHLPNQLTSEQEEVAE